MNPTPRDPRPPLTRAQAVRALHATVAACTDLPALEEQAAVLLTEIRAIENQLTERPRLTDATPEYRNWRRRAVTARDQKTDEYRILKARIRELRMAAHTRTTWAAAALPAAPDAGLLLRRALALFQELARSGRAQYRADEQALVDATQAHVQGQAAATAREDDTADPP